MKAMTYEETINQLSKIRKLMVLDSTMAINMAIKVLESKQSEAHLVTESDFENADQYGFLPVWTEERDGDLYCECIPKSAINYSNTLGLYRCWTGKPTENQRRNTPWDDKYTYVFKGWV